jgi:8-oxo-dGTP pyrophosphatase MutT (NUDIX family)
MLLCRVPDSIVANPRPASTVIVLRDGPAGPEVFLVRRHEATAFMGGAHVFPGGRVDAGDHNGDASWCDGVDWAASQLPDLDREQAVAYHVAAARELFEEAGVLLARTVAREHFAQDRADVHGGRATLRAVVEREGLRLALDSLVLCAHWVTPPIDTRQFDTRFFLARLPPGQTPIHDETETTHSTWLTPAAALAAASSGTIVLPPPTWTTLRELEPFKAVEGALAWARTRRIARRQPKLVEHDGRRMLLIPGDPLYPEAVDPESPHETRFVSVDKHWRAERPGS